MVLLKLNSRIIKTKQCHSFIVLMFPPHLISRWNVRIRKNLEDPMLMSQDEAKTNQMTFLLSPIFTMVDI